MLVDRSTIIQMDYHRRKATPSIMTFDRLHQQSSVMKNSSKFIEPTFDFYETIDTLRTSPDLTLWIYVTISIFFGILMNLLVLRSLHRIKCNGAHFLVMQIVFADLISLIQVKLELFYVAHRTWSDAPEFCSIYLGVDTFTNTSIVFFIVAINLHAVSTFNLAEKTIARNAARSLIVSSDDCEGVDSDEGEFQSQQNQRSIVIDYSKPKHRISVILPIVFIWLLSASMSVPLFWQGTVLPTRDNPKFCGVIQSDRSNNLLLQILLIKMRIIVPSLCLLFSTVFVIIKLCTVKRTIRPCGLDEDVRQLLILALSLSITFMLLSLQRIFGSLWFELIARPMMEHKYAAFDPWIGIIGTMLHYLAPTIRPIIYRCLDRNLTNDNLFGCDCCCGRRKK